MEEGAQGQGQAGAVGLPCVPGMLRAVGLDPKGASCTIKPMQGRTGGDGPFAAWRVCANRGTLTRTSSGKPEFPSLWDVSAAQLRMKPFLQPALTAWPRDRQWMRDRAHGVNLQSEVGLCKKLVISDTC